MENGQENINENKESGITNGSTEQKTPNSEVDSDVNNTEEVEVLNAPEKQEEDLTEKELKKKELQETKKHKKEEQKALHDISESLHVKKKWGKIITRIVVGVLLLLSLVVISYAILCFRIVDKARHPFTEAYFSDMNLFITKKYAMKDMKKIKRLAERQISLDMFLKPKSVAESYKKGLKNLEHALQTSEAKKQHYDATITKFSELYKEAETRNFSRYASKIWMKIVQLENNAGKENNPDFNYQICVNNLEKATKILEKNRKSYDDIVEYEKQNAEFKNIYSMLSEDEMQAYNKNKYDELQKKINELSSKVKEYKWKDAIKILKELKISINEVTEEIRKTKEMCMKAFKEFAEEYSKTRYQEYHFNYPEKWEKMKNLRSTAFDNQRDYLYAKAAENFKKALDSLVKMKKQLTLLKKKANKYYSLLEKTYKKAPHNLLRKNSLGNWKLMCLNFRKTESLSSTFRYDELIKRSKTTYALLKKLRNKVDKLRTQYEIERKKFDEYLKKMNEENFLDELMINNKSEWLRVTKIKVKAISDGERKDYSEALNKIKKAISRLKACEKDIKALRTYSTSQLEMLRKDIEKYEPGLQAFEKTNWSQIKESFSLGQEYLEEKKYVYSKPLIEKLLKLVPRKRFVKKSDNQVIIDYTKGLMWASDGLAAGCNGGKKLTWYEAKVVVNELNFGGYATWRLPTMEEQKYVFDSMPKEQLDSLFVNTKLDRYWCSDISDQSVDHAGTYDFLKDK
ncbi:MAG: DUF1566 domain-containing protein, partial [Verrucomicrobiota bacterium]|nr:DUF1566 domain-containing protein [Verrucomicrobiota bacterium]